MAHTAEEGPPERFADELFAEYLEEREGGRQPNAGALLLRAGPVSEELNRRIQVYETLHTMGGALRSTGIAAPRPRLRPASRVGRFELVRPLGRGEHSQVYLARDPELQREVALKVMSPFELGTPDVHGWMLREGRSLAALDHEGVVRVHEVGEDDGLAYVVMERLHGSPLRSVLDALAGEPLDDRRTVDFARELQSMSARSQLALRLALALAYCHARGVLHRDLKPENVLVTAGLRPVIIDFGLASVHCTEDMSPRATQLLMGTPAYMAPEQLRTASIGTNTRSEVFSFGILLVELLTGVNPFERETTEETRRAIELATLPRPRSVSREIPPDLERIALHCLEARPEDRYGTMMEVAEDLEAFLDHRSISLSSAPRAVLLSAARRHRHKLLALGAMILVLLAGACMAWLAEHRGDRLQLLAEVRAARESLDEVTLPDEFQLSFQEAVDWRARAARLDGRQAATLLFAPAGPDVAESIDALSARLASVLRQERERTEAYGYDLDLAPWRGVLAQERALCPECDHNRVDRDGGRVQLVLPDAEVAVWLAAQRSSTRDPTRLLPLFVEHEVPPASVRGELPLTLPTGFYRLQLRDPRTAELQREGDFPIRWSDPRREMELRPIDPRLRASLVEIEWTERSFVEAISWTGVVRDLAPIRQRDMTAGESFWISAEPITWGDLREFAEACPPELDELGEHYRKKLWSYLDARDAREQAEVWWVVAQAYARWRGARLPTALELACALRAPGAPLAIDPRLIEGGGELTSSPAGIANSMFTVSYEDVLWFSANTERAWLRAMDCEGFPLGTRFRLALSGRPPAKLP